MAGNGKINHGKGMFGAAALTFPFQNIEIGEKDILYGVPSEVRKQLNTEGNRLVAIKSYEVAFHRYNFMRSRPGKGAHVWIFFQSAVDALGNEDWELRKKVLHNLVCYKYYERVGCKEMMSELSERLCVSKEEFLAFADMLNQSGEYEYEKKAAALYHQYGREDKYISYLESHLEKEGKTYAALVDCYQRQGNIDGARKTARQGLEQCRDELTDLLIWLLADAGRRGDAEGYKKLYASAKRRRGADITKIDAALKACVLQGGLEVHPVKN